MNLNWIYYNLDDLFKDLNFTGDFIINKFVVENTMQTGEGFLHVFDIEYGLYKIRISAFSNYPDFIDEPIIYRLYIVEIEINEENYFYLFPYKNIEEYLEDNYFGRILDFNTGENNIFYRCYKKNEYGDDFDYYSDLRFINGLLKSIRIISFTP